MKRQGFFLGFVAYAVTIAVILGVGAFWLISEKYFEPGPLEETTLYEVEKGSSLRKIAEDLDEAGIINSPFVFMTSAVILGDQGRLQAGEYEFKPGMSIGNILYLIKEGKTFDRSITVREGLTSHQIVQLLKEAENLTGEIEAIPPEGTLLPQTYDYRRNEPRERVIGRMQQAMEETLKELWPKRYKNLPYETLREAMVLASIVEKETGVPEERKKVAGVFINRLKKNMPLQTDPTVIYAITEGKHKSEGSGPLGRRLLSRDLEFDSPYNTYLHPGLPPGPICNPGRASIEAAMQPEAHNYLYFVADGKGGHVFAETLDEHNRNVENWRRIRKEKEAAEKKKQEDEN